MVFLDENEVLPFLKSPWSALCKNGILLKIPLFQNQRTSDGGNGNHSVSLPIILIKIKVDQMLPYSYISLLLVSIL